MAHVKMIVLEIVMLDVLGIAIQVVMGLVISIAVVINS